MTNKELMLQYFPIHELTMTRLRNQIDELRKMHDGQLTNEKEKIILERQKQIADTLRTIDGKMPA